MSQTPQRSINLALLQLDPIFKQPLQTIAQANSIIQHLIPGQIDILILPELAFAGYNYQSYEEIQPFVESEIDGLSVTWAKQTATRLDCHVLIGFAQQIPEQEQLSPNQPKCYNALAIISNQAQVLKIYHKTQLYPPVDPLWARPGSGFLRIDLRLDRNPSLPLIKCCFGICMDLSPDKFEAPFEDFELSTFAIDQGAEILICPMAWLNSDPDPDPHHTSTGKSWSEVGPTINYWAARCTPLWNQPGKSFVCCNRVGREGDTVYTGSSCVLSNVDPSGTSRHLDTPLALAWASKHSPELLITRVPLLPLDA